MIMAMKATAETAQPMPNIPQMSVKKGTDRSILAESTNPGKILTLQQRETYQQEALDAIADMQ